mmetsp:Transcript_27932/g.46959  ORF Transcript_27932/g.46959 Transcript_27932/m.46959 type:complete len:255 (+) Transcript_27932:539-1303(+)
MRMELVKRRRRMLVVVVVVAVVVVLLRRVDPPLLLLLLLLLLVVLRAVLRVALGLVVAKLLVLVLLATSAAAAAAAGSVERFYQYWLQDARQPRAEHHHRHLWRRGRREWQRGQVLARQAVFSGPEKVDFPYRSPATLRAAADQCGNQSRQDRGREGAEGDDCFAESARERREGGAAACRGLTGDPGQAARCGGAALGILAADPRARHQRVRQGERGAALEQHPQCRGHRAAAGGSGGQNPGRECTQARATIRH